MHTQSESARQSKENPFLAFRGDQVFITLTEDEKFAEAFPGVDRRTEYLKMDAWYVAAVNCGKRKKLTRPAMFAFHWLAKAPRTLSVSQDSYFQVDSDGMDVRFSQDRNYPSGN